MYTAYYGFNEKPFTLSPDPKYLFLSESHREVLGHLIYGIEQGEGFIAITGEVGTGKTTLCRTLLQRLGNESEVAYLFNPNLSPTDLVKAVNAEFGLNAAGDSIPELTAHLNSFLVDKKLERRRVLLIVDEAQNLSPPTLEQIRLLSNLETETSKLIQIVLIGQPELDAKLEANELRQLRQRISVWWHLGPLSACETRDYVRHRLRIAAGSDRRWFSDSAIALIHRLSRGVPRVINILCDRSLLAGYGEGVRLIDGPLVAGVAKEVRPRRAKAATSWRMVAPWAWATLGGLVGSGALALGWLWLGEDARVESAAKAPIAQVAAAAPPPAPEIFDAREISAAPEISHAPSPSPAREEFSPAPVSTGNGDGETASLDTLLSERTPSEANSLAADAALRSWKLPTLESPELSLGEALFALEERGLSALPLRGANVEALRRFNLPAILRFDAPDGSLRSVFLQVLVGDRATFSGAIAGSTVTIGLEQFEAHWRGEGFVLWREFEALPQLMGPGDSGSEIRWLQRSLGRLGFYGAVPTETFDEHTRAAVRAFQHSEGLEADGSVGPRTKIRLYDTLRLYAMPDLVDGEVGLARSR